MLSKLHKLLRIYTYLQVRYCCNESKQKILTQDYGDKFIEPFKSNCDLTGRYLICGRNLSSDEIKSVLWTALDLKSSFQHNNISKCLEKYTINIIMESSNVGQQIAASTAAKQLGALVNTISIRPLTNHSQSKIRDLGLIVMAQSDLILTSTYSHSTLIDICNKSDIPIISMGSSFQQPVTALATLMAIQEEFGCVNGLKVALIGAPEPYLHSLMCTIVRLGMHATFSCSDQTVLTNNVSPRFYNTVEETHSKQADVSITERIAPEEAVKDSDVIINFTGSVNKLQSNCNQCIFHSLSCINGDNFELNSFTRNKIVNLKYCYAALMVRFLSCGYQHSIDKPIF